MLKEAKRLYDMGMAPHWIKRNSKAPVKPNWQAPVRDTWKTLTREHQEGFGLGVKMGEASKFEDGTFLANIDVDIKSQDPRHKKEALAELDRIFPGLRETCPYVKTGYGRRYFVRTKKPLTSGKLTQSSETCKVFQPGTKISPHQAASKLVTKQELQKGFREKCAWELEFMGIGRQVLVPPSVHPDTKTPYVWARAINDWRDIPLLPADFVVAGNGHKSVRGKKTILKDFKPAEVDLKKLPKDVRLAIRDGHPDKEDQSAAAFSVTLSMVRAGFKDAQIMTVLTDRTNVLGEVAYRHRGGTNSRKAAAAWVLDYCIKKARKVTSAEAAYEDIVEVTPNLDKKAVEKQEKALHGKLPPDDPMAWTNDLERTSPLPTSPLKRTLRNVVLILTNDISPIIFRHDEFRCWDIYGMDAPWTGGTKGAAPTDVHITAINMWFAETWNFEPGRNLIEDAVGLIAHENCFHPVRKELERLPDWDGKDRLSTWLADYFGAKGESEYLAQVFTKWLLGSIARTYVPGTKLDWMPIFEGAQGTGKSSFPSILFGDKYFGDWLPELTNKDAALSLPGIRCQEFSELESMRKNEVETTKAFITRRVDKVRPHYGRRVQELPRQTVFCGTTNRQLYFRDDTGNRRFAPVEVGRLNFKQLRKDRKQLWAQALWIYNNTFDGNLELTNKALDFAKKMQSAKVVEDGSISMEVAIKEAKKKKTFPKNDFRTPSLFGVGAPLESWKENNYNYQLAAKALRNLGFKTRFSHGYMIWVVEK